MSDIRCFTRDYACKRWVYYEHYECMVSAIEREKQIKAGSRKKNHTGTPVISGEKLENNSKINGLKKNECENVPENDQLSQMVTSSAGTTAVAPASA